jgi:hypothetical protein
MIRAGPAPYRTTSPVAVTSPAAAVPRVEKMPAPITAPIERLMRSRGPRVRYMPPSAATAMGFLAKSDVIGGGNYPVTGGAVRVGSGRPARCQRGASATSETVSRTGVPSDRTAGRNRTSDSISRILRL